MPEVTPNTVVGYVVVIAMMTGVASTCSREQFMLVWRHRAGLIVALLCQFALMPALAVAMSKMAGLGEVHSVAVLVVGCAPGGALSNVLCFVAKADVALSIVASASSTLLALGLMPLMLFLYTPLVSDAARLKVPYGMVCASLACVLVPATSGALVRWYSERAAWWLGRVCVVVSFGCVVTMVALADGGFTGLSTARLWLAGSVMVPSGFFLGYVLAKLARLPEASCRAVCFETGLQNCPLSIGVMSLSFEEHTASQMLGYAMVYQICMSVYGASLSGVFRYLAVKEQLKGQGQLAEGTSEAPPVSIGVETAEVGAGSLPPTAPLEPPD